LKPQSELNKITITIYFRKFFIISAKRVCSDFPAAPCLAIAGTAKPQAIQVCHCERGAAERGNLQNNQLSIETSSVFASFLLL